MFPNGSLKFYKDYVLALGQKSYFKGGGAFWYDSHIDYNQKLAIYSLQLYAIATMT